MRSKQKIVLQISRRDILMHLEGATGGEEEGGRRRVRRRELGEGEL